MKSNVQSHTHELLPQDTKPLRVCLEGITSIGKSSLFRAMIQQLRGTHAMPENSFIEEMVGINSKPQTAVPLHVQIGDDIKHPVAAVLDAEGRLTDPISLLDAGNQRLAIEWNTQLREVVLFLPGPLARIELIDLPGCDNPTPAVQQLTKCQPDLILLAERIGVPNHAPALEAVLGWLGRHIPITAFVPLIFAITRADEQRIENSAQGCFREMKHLRDLISPKVCMFFTSAKGALDYQPLNPRAYAYMRSMLQEIPLENAGDRERLQQFLDSRQGGIEHLVRHLLSFTDQVSTLRRLRELVRKAQARATNAANVEHKLQSKFRSVQFALDAAARQILQPRSPSWSLPMSMQLHAGATLWEVMQALQPDIPQQVAMAIAALHGQVAAAQPHKSTWPEIRKVLEPFLDNYKDLFGRVLLQAGSEGELVASTGLPLDTSAFQVAVNAIKDYRKTGMTVSCGIVWDQWIAALYLLGGTLKEQLLGDVLRIRADADQDDSLEITKLSQQFE